MNQLTVPFQELQDRATSLMDSRDFHDLETASSCGLSHFLSHLFECPEVKPESMKQTRKMFQLGILSLYCRRDLSTKFYG